MKRKSWDSKILFCQSFAHIKTAPNVKKVYNEYYREIKRKNNFKDYTFFIKRIKGIKID